MAEIIHNPQLGVEQRRQLPIGKEQNIASDSNSQHVPEQIDTGYVTSLLAERDQALQRAEHAQEALNELRLELDRYQKEAKSEGYRVGLEKAEMENKVTQAKRDEELKALLKQMREEQVQLIRRAEEAAIEIGFASVVKLIGKMKADPTLVQALVQQAMSQVIDREGLVVWLSSTDYQRMQQMVRTNQREWQGIELRLDDQIELGGCRIDSRSGSLDARLEVQMKALKALLTRSNSHSSVGLS